MSKKKTVLLPRSRSRQRLNNSIRKPAKPAKPKKGRR